MDAQDAAESTSTQTRTAGASSPRAQASDSDSKPSAAVTASSAKSAADDAPADRDSDAETIVLPGKDGHSPSKARKVRQEDKSDADADAVARAAGTTRAATAAAAAANNDSSKKKRLAASADKDKTKDGSSGLSSAPASPSRDEPRGRRRSHGSASQSGESEKSNPNKSSKTPLRDRLKSGDRLLSNKRRAPKAESDDEDDTRKPRRQRTASTGGDGARPSKDRTAAPKSQQDAKGRSPSPPARQHRRSISSQLPPQSSNGMGLKKRRLPPPLQPVDYHSDDSDDSGSPPPRSSKTRQMANSANADSNASPVKVPPHKKHLDAHGQTFLARACARGEYDGVKQRLADRPEDLNVADYAGNTPLQIAAINGCEGIVKLLIEAGCNMDCVNYDKDTPLLDAVDNGHLGVVKLLLDAGVNPRKANVNGEEPIDRVPEDADNANEIRTALMDARKRAGDRRRLTSEDRHSHQEYHDARESHAPDSPRRSPTASVLSTTAARRTGTVRSTKTRNDLLYMPLDDKTLRQAAGRGDEETVARILQVKEGFDDPESMVAAARGGHDLVIQLLLGLGSANPDPAPASSLPPEFATPILAAIGQENIKVVELLLEQQSFDPTRRFKGETYYEIARRRQGTNWKEEEQMLKNAYDEYKRSHKDSSAKAKSPGRRARERDREEKRARKDESREEGRSHRRNLSSPTRESESRKKASASSKLSSPREKRRSDSVATHGDEQVPKRGPGRPKKENSSAQTSDRELSPTLSHKALKTKLSEVDATGGSSDGESLKPRRKLVSKGELRGERDKHRRSSMVSDASSLKEPSSPRESRTDDASTKTKMTARLHDKAKVPKRDDSKDASGDGPNKRHRASGTPDQPGNGDKDDEEAVPAKRRRIEGDGPEKRQKGAAAKSSSSRDEASKAGRKSRGGEAQDGTPELERPNTTESSIHVKSEELDVEMPDAVEPKGPDDADVQATEEQTEAEAKKKKLAHQEETKKREERERAEIEAKKKHEEEEEKKRQVEEQSLKEKAERQAEKKQKEEEQRLKREEEEEKKRREAEEAARVEEEKRRVEEEKRKKEEDERRQREEEERMRREQLEREAAEEARRKREEEERKERERRERAHKEEMERKRAAREAEQRRIREEQERVRLDKLPGLLQWLDRCPNPKTAAVAEKVSKMQGARYDTIRTGMDHTAEGREQWVLNTDVALLLGEKDLNLSRYTAWERVGVSQLAKKTLWRTEGLRYSLIDERLWDFGRQLPGYYHGDDPSVAPFSTKQQLQQTSWERFRDLDMFFVKVSDLLYTVPNIPHLRNIRIAVEYRELLESDAPSNIWGLKSKWKQDPDIERLRGFAPRCKYYVNGTMVGEDLPVKAETSKTPFPEKRVPRRGLMQVLPDDPEYVKICLEQGLVHLVKVQQSPTLANGVHGMRANPTSIAPVATAAAAASAAPAAAVASAVPTGLMINGLNGHSAPESANSTAATNGGGMPNGINGSSG